MKLPKTQKRLIRPRDLYVSRPMRLIKSAEHARLMSPYNLLARLHLIETDEYDALTLKESLNSGSIKLSQYLKAQIQSRVPEHLYDAMVTEKSQIFEISSTDITLGVETNRTIYADLFSGKPYFSDSIRCSHTCVEPGDEFIFIEYINSLVDELHKQVITNGYDFIDEIEYLEHLILQNHQLQDESALKTLKEILNKIRTVEGNREVTVYREETKQFIDEAHFGSYSLDINGNKIPAKPKVKVYEKRI